MKDKLKVLAICGSTRRLSSNLNLINAFADLAAEKIAVTAYGDLTSLPHFNPDLDTDVVPEEVKAFREELAKADGVLISTPEYAMGVPGTLKNALDWTVSSMDFSKKPVALITASLSGEKAHRSLLETLLVIESRMTADTQLLIPFVKTKISPEGKITDEKTLAEVNKLITSFIELIENKPAHLLSGEVLTSSGFNSAS